MGTTVLILFHLDVEILQEIRKAVSYPEIFSFEDLLRSSIDCRSISDKVAAETRL